LAEIRINGNYPTLIWSIVHGLVIFKGISRFIGAQNMAWSEEKTTVLAVELLLYLREDCDKRELRERNRFPGSLWFGS
jgi:hypothetical protein